MLGSCREPGRSQPGGRIEANDLPCRRAVTNRRAAASRRIGGTFHADFVVQAVLRFSGCGLFPALLAGIALACLRSSVLAGPNEDGTLILALSHGTTYTSDQATYCDSASLTDCQSAVTSLSAGEVDGPAVIHVLGAFPSTANPLVDAVAFGVFWTPGEGFAAIDDWGLCGAFELPTADWPMPGSGNAVTWAPSMTAHLFEVYWFAIDPDVGAYGPGYLRLGAHSLYGGIFSGGHPSSTDPITGYGQFGFGAAGSLPCPGVAGGCCLPDGTCILLSPSECGHQDGLLVGPSCEPDPCAGYGAGACCLPGSMCAVMVESACDGAGGIYQGNGVPCDPNPCPLIGACCFDDCSCLILTLDECLAQGGMFRGGANCNPDTCPCPPGACCIADGCLATDEAECDLRGGLYLGDGSNCGTNPCVPVPTHEESWGLLKHRYYMGNDPGSDSGGGR